LTVLTHEHRHQILDHCRSALPNEACGMLAIDGDRIARVYPTENADRSPVSYTIPPEQHFAALTDAESNGWRLAGVFHSHPSGPPAMSVTDLAKVTDPEWLYLVVSLDGAEPRLVGWRNGATVEV